LVAWDTLFRPKEKGGLGLQDPGIVNRAQRKNMVVLAAKERGNMEYIIEA
jgi:hypothetical protein